MFVPISFLPGQTGGLFREFGFVLAISVRALLRGRADALPDAGLAHADRARRIHHDHGGDRQAAAAALLELYRRAACMPASTPR